MVMVLSTEDELQLEVDRLRNERDQAREEATQAREERDTAMLQVSFAKPMSISQVLNSISPLDTTGTRRSHGTRRSGEGSRCSS